MDLIRWFRDFGWKLRGVDRTSEALSAIESAIARVRSRDPVWFAENVMGACLLPWQKYLIRRLAANPAIDRSVR